MFTCGNNIIILCATPHPIEIVLVASIARERGTKIKRKCLSAGHTCTRLDLFFAAESECKLGPLSKLQSTDNAFQLRFAVRHLLTHFL